MQKRFTAGTHRANQELQCSKEGVYACADALEAGMEPEAGEWATNDDLPKLALLQPDLVRPWQGRLAHRWLASGLHAQVPAVSSSLTLCTAGAAGVSCQRNICIAVLITSLSVLANRPRPLLLL